MVVQYLFHNKSVTDFQSHNTFLSFVIHKMLKTSNLLKDPEIANLFVTEDPERIFSDLVEIGHGSFGAVYCARHAISKEVVAIKKITYHGKQSSDKWRDIIKEVKFFKSLKHRNCVEFKGCFLKESTAWLVMEYCLGSASNLIEVHKKPLAENEISAVCQGTLLGLQYLHSRNCIHRDVKAGNILLTEDGTVKLADFGSASMTSPANSFIGTPYWMAPEVITAMEEGKYSDRADIWSLGITCIELAETKPPLFNMNAMSALYHIAQNDPPTLSTASNWTNNFVDFVNMCLTKEPSKRPSSNECLAMSFVTKEHAYNVLYELICRTREAVRELDSLQAAKFQKKILYAISETNGEETTDLAIVRNLIVEDISTGDESTEENYSSKSGSVNSHTSHASEASASSVQHVNDSTLVRAPDKEIPTIALRQTPSDNQAENEANCNNFATIRTTSIVKQQQREKLGRDFMREQMTNYRQIRRQHSRQLQQLECRQLEELDELRQKLGKQFDARQAAAAREIEVHLQQQAKERERAQHAAVMQEGKRRRHIQQYQEQELRQLHQQQKKDYQKNKDDIRKSADLSGNRDSIRSQKDSLKQQHVEVEQTLTNNHRAFLDLEIRKLRRCKLLQYHLLEQNLFKEHLDRRQVNLELAHETLVRNDELLREQEYKHLKMRHQQSDDLLQRQHQVELANQREYMKHAEQEMKQRHLGESRQLPKNLKAKEQDIRRQYRETVKTQMKQYKILKEHCMRKTSKAEQKPMLTKLKEDQDRRVAMLCEQYEQSITEVRTHQNIRMDATQIAEESVLRDRLESELELLMAYQSKICMHTEGLHQRERKELDERVTLRREQLIQRTETEMAAFLSEREQKMNDLLRRQSYELEQFDLHSLSLGLKEAKNAPTEGICDDDTDSVHSLNLGALRSPRTPSTSSR